METIGFDLMYVWAVWVFKLLLSSLTIGYFYQNAHRMDIPMDVRVKDDFMDRIYAFTILTAIYEDWYMASLGKVVLGTWFFEIIFGRFILLALKWLRLYDFIANRMPQRPGALRENFGP